jgi:hypothetical protein
MVAASLHSSRGRRGDFQFASEHVVGSKLALFLVNHLALAFHEGQKIQTYQLQQIFGTQTKW